MNPRERGLSQCPSNIQPKSYIGDLSSPVILWLSPTTLPSSQNNLKQWIQNRKAPAGVQSYNRNRFPPYSSQQLRQLKLPAPVHDIKIPKIQITSHSKWRTPPMLAQNLHQHTTIKMARKIILHYDPNCVSIIASFDALCLQFHCVAYHQPVVYCIV